METETRTMPDDYAPREERIAYNGWRYVVTLRSDNEHVVRVIKTRRAAFGGREFYSTIKPHSAKWNRLVRLAYEASGLLQQ